MLPEEDVTSLVDKVKSAVYQDGQIVVGMESGIEIRFPVAGNPRLSNGRPEQLNNIDVSPFGLHWPDLDEDLSFRGLREGTTDRADHADREGIAARLPPEAEGQR